jgi:hypothetical protein
MTQRRSPQGFVLDQQKPIEDIECLDHYEEIARVSGNPSPNFNFDFVLERLVPDTFLFKISQKRHKY